MTSSVNGFIGSVRCIESYLYGGLITGGISSTGSFQSVEINNNLQVTGSSLLNKVNASSLVLSTGTRSTPSLAFTGANAGLFATDGAVGISSRGNIALSIGNQTGALFYYGGGNNLEHIKWSDEITIGPGSGTAQIAKIVFAGSGAVYVDIKAIDNMRDGSTRRFIGGYNVENVNGGQLSSVKLFSMYSDPFFSVTTSPNIWTFNVDMNAHNAQSVSMNLDIYGPNSAISAISSVSVI